MDYPPDKILVVKTGSHGIFHMTYTNNDISPKPIDLENYEIYMIFVDPRTRKVLKSTNSLLSTESTGDEERTIDGGITILDKKAGTYSVNAGDTSKWPLGMMPVDIKYVNGGRPQHTETFFLKIEQGYTP